MKVDASKSAYHEAPEARNEFTRGELRSLRLLLRRLRFLEDKSRNNRGIADSDGGAAFVEWEIEALEWILTEVGFLPDKTEQVASV